MLNTVSHGIKIINFKMADVKMRAMAMSFGSDEDNNRSLDFFFQHVACQLEEHYREYTSKVAREVKELARAVFKKILSQIYHHTPGTNLRVVGRPINSPTGARAAEEAVAHHVTHIMQGCTRRDVSASAKGSSRA